MGPCVYCGATLSVKKNYTRDHVLPKNLFARPRPSDLITVACCKRCNSGFTRHEDLFLATVFAGRASETPEGSKVWEQTVSRMWEKNRGLAIAVARRARMVDVYTPGGLYLGKHMAVHADMSRLGVVLSKIVRGLFWYEFRTTIPRNTYIKTTLFAEGQDLTPIRMALAHGTRCWKGTAEYWCGRESEDETESGWLLSFYDTVHFWAYVSPNRRTSER